ncbi:MAG: Na-translocating system protein MpsC family protein [Solirubrobacteraceae bacterium]
MCETLVSASVSGLRVLRPGGSPPFPLPALDFSSLGKGEIGRLMADRREQDQPAVATLPAAISHAVVGLLREYTGRGPMTSRTSIRDNVVLVMLEQTLTKGERSLVSKGRADKVIEIRHEFQEAMREDCMANVAELTGREVVAMLSANHVNPDLGAEIFVLDGPPEHARLSPAEATDGTPLLISDPHEDTAAVPPP